MCVCGSRGCETFLTFSLPSLSAYVWVPALLLTLFIAAARGSWAAGITFLLAATSARKPLLARRWPSVEHSRVFDCWRKRHRYRVVVPARPYCSDRAMFSHFPHAVFPMGCFMSMPLR